MLPQILSLLAELSREPGSEGEHSSSSSSSSRAGGGGGGALQGRALRWRAASRCTQACCTSPCAACLPTRRTLKRGAASPSRRPTHRDLARRLPPLHARAAAPLCGAAQRGGAHLRLLAGAQGRPPVLPASAAFAAVAAIDAPTDAFIAAAIADCSPGPPPASLAPPCPCRSSLRWTRYARWPRAGGPPAAAAAGAQPPDCAGGVQPASAHPGGNAGHHAGVCVCGRGGGGGGGG